MDNISGRPGRPVAQREIVQQHSAQRPGAEAPRTRVEPPKKNKKSLLFKIIGLLVAGALLAGLIYAYNKSTSVPIASGKYQAVFLTNGQVYFGKLHRAGEYYKLTDVYYLQASQSSGDSSNPQKAAESNAGVQLIKLGNEVHGPEDAMIIDKSQVLFFENLKNDGKVVDSISKYQKK